MGNLLKTQSKMETLLEKLNNLNTPEAKQNLTCIMCVADSSFWPAPPVQATKLSDKEW